MRCKLHVSGINNSLIWFRRRILTLKVNAQFLNLGYNFLLSQKKTGATDSCRQLVLMSAPPHVYVDTSVAEKMTAKCSKDSQTDL